MPRCQGANRAQLLTARGILEPDGAQSQHGNFRTSVDEVVRKRKSIDLKHSTVNLPSSPFAVPSKVQVQIRDSSEEANPIASSFPPFDCVDTVCFCRLSRCNESPHARWAASNQATGILCARTHRCQFGRTEFHVSAKSQERNDEFVQDLLVLRIEDGACGGKGGL